MKYLNASDVLPEKLLKEIQQYAGGALLYVPKNETDRKEWGEVSGERRYYKKRNRMIINQFIYGVTIDQLAQEYCLSKETVKKIVYSKKNVNELIFYPDVSSAKEYSGEGLLEEWIHTYLLFERRNQAFSDGLRREERFYLGPLALPLQLLERSSGPEDEMKWKVDADIFERRVAEWRAKIKNKQFLPPIIAGYTEDGFEINCNNPLFEALLRENTAYFPVIIWSTKECDYKDFLKKYTPYAKFVLN